MNNSAHEKQFQMLAEKHKISVAEVKEAILPSVGDTFALNGFLYRVTVCNVGKMRFSAEFLGAYKPPVVDKKPFIKKFFPDKPKG